MTKYATLLSGIAAMLLGVLQAYFLIFCWGYIVVYSPLLMWAIDHGFRGNVLLAIVRPLDFLISVILSIPAAFVLVKLRPARLWLYLALAVVPAFAWLNRDLVNNSFALAHWSSFVIGWITELFALPIAAILILLLKGRAPNNSFKPKPLRGSA